MSAHRHPKRLQRTGDAHEHRCFTLCISRLKQSQLCAQVIGKICNPGQQFRSDITEVVFGQGSHLGAKLFSRLLKDVLDVLRLVLAVEFEFYTVRPLVCILRPARYPCRATSSSALDFSLLFLLKVSHSKIIAGVRGSFKLVALVKVDIWRQGSC